MKLLQGLINLATLYAHRTLQVQLQSRNLFILKRVHPVRKNKFNAKIPKPLMDNEYDYEVVADTRVIKRVPIDVILTEYAEGLGQRGDKIALKPNFARRLILLNRAVYASPENIDAFEQEKKDHPYKKLVHSSIYSSKTIRYLSKLVVPVTMGDETPWTIEPGHIRTAFRLSGITLPETAIELPKEKITGPDKEKENKDFAVFITINNLERVPVRCRLLHWMKDQDNFMPKPAELANELCEPILEEQIELLSPNAETNTEASG